MGKLLKANVIALLILVSLVVAYYTPYETHTSTLSQHYTPYITEDSIWLLIAMNVIMKINEERQKFGVPPVSPFGDPTAAFRARDMRSNKYFGHCDLNGMPPNYHYTRLNGRYVIEENLAYASSWIITLSPGAAISKATVLVYDMIYRDAASNWGHRDSLLDPTNNYVSIYAVLDKSELLLVIHMMKIWVEWIVPPTIRDGVFRAEGIILLNGSKLVGVSIYYSSPNTSRTSVRELNIVMTCQSYSIGEELVTLLLEPFAVRLPKPYSSEILQRMLPVSYTISGQYFGIEFPTSFTNERGLYTIVLWAKNTLSVKHPFDKKRYSDLLPILEYTFYW